MTSDIIPPLWILQALNKLFFLSVMRDCRWTARSCSQRISGQKQRRTYKVPKKSVRASGLYTIKDDQRQIGTLMDEESQVKCNLLDYHKKLQVTIKCMQETRRWKWKWSSFSKRRWKTFKQSIYTISSKLKLNIVKEQVVTLQRETYQDIVHQNEHEEWLEKHFKAARRSLQQSSRWGGRLFENSLHSR